MKRKKNNQEQFVKFLLRHHRDCSFYRFSGDRKCSCGRDEMLEKIKTLKNEKDIREFLEKLNLALDNQ